MNDMDRPSLPVDMEAEKAVLGALMLAPDHIDTVSSRLRVEDFYRRDHQLIFRAITELHARRMPVDSVTLADYFTAHGLDALAGGPAYAIELANNTPSAANVRTYADLVRAAGDRRRLIDCLEQLTRDAYDPTTPMGEVIGRGHADLLALESHGTSHERTMGQAMAAALDMARATKAGDCGIPTGIKALDRLLGGLRGGDVTTAAARPGQGKTALGVNVALHVAAQGVAVGMFSAEQPAEQIGARALSLRANVAGHRIRTGQLQDVEFHRLYDEAREGAALPIVIHDRPLLTIADVERIARRWKRDHNIGLLFVDYAQRVEASRADRRAPKHERVGEVMRGLKNIARELDIPVVVLAQVSREADNRPGGCPQLCDLADSSEIEKESDQIITLHRPYDYDDTQPQALALLSILKNRHGPTGQIKAAWIEDFMRFGNYAEYA